MFGIMYKFRNFFIPIYKLNKNRNKTILVVSVYNFCLYMYLTLYSMKKTPHYGPVTVDLKGSRNILLFKFSSEKRKF